MERGEAMKQGEVPYLRTKKACFEGFTRGTAKQAADYQTADSRTTTSLAHKKDRGDGTSTAQQKLFCNLIAFFLCALDFRVREAFQQQKLSN